MKTFGLKAFLRAIAIFVSVYLVKIGVDRITQTPDTYLKIIYTLTIIVVVLLVIIVPSLMPSTKHENSGKDRKAE
jgi:nitrogen fixation/metabolism regulation signal transduction histidine kinase